MELAKCARRYAIELYQPTKQKWNNWSYRAEFSGLGKFIYLSTRNWMTQKAELESHSELDRFVTIRLTCSLVFLGVAWFILRLKAVFFLLSLCSKACFSVLFWRKCAKKIQKTRTLMRLLRYLFNNKRGPAYDVLLFTARHNVHTIITERRHNRRKKKKTRKMWGQYHLPATGVALFCATKFTHNHKPSTNTNVVLRSGTHIIQIVQTYWGQKIDEQLLVEWGMLRFFLPKEKTPIHIRANTRIFKYWNDDWQGWLGQYWRLQVASFP